MCALDVPADRWGPRWVCKINSNRMKTLFDSTPEQTLNSINASKVLTQYVDGMSGDNVLGKLFVQAVTENDKRPLVGCHDSSGVRSGDPTSFRC